MNTEGKQLYEFVKAKIDYLKSFELTDFGKGRLNAYEEIEEQIEWLKPIIIGQGNSDAVELIEWLNLECPTGTDVWDLSHDFAQSLRSRLDNLAAQPKQEDKGGIKTNKV